MSSLRGIPPIAVGKADPQVNLKQSLGFTWELSGKIYRLVQANTAIAACANKVLVFSVASHLPVWTVTTTTSASSPLVAGVVVSGQLGSDGSTGLLNGDYFLIQVAGACTPLVHTTATAAGSCIVTATTAGTGDAVSATYAAITNGTIFAKLLEASSGTDAATAALLENCF